MNKKVLMGIGIGASVLLAAIPLAYMVYKKRMCKFDDEMYAFLSDEVESDV